MKLVTPLGEKDPLHEDDLAGHRVLTEVPPCLVHQAGCDCQTQPDDYAPLQKDSLALWAS